jgi:hypothetical protein
MKRLEGGVSRISKDGNSIYIIKFEYSVEISH